MLTRLGLITWGEDARINNGQAKKHAADVRAKGLASTIAKIHAITRELSERNIPTALGGKWHSTSVKRLLRRLKRLESRTASDE
jgi:hypothetical protein